MGDENKILNPTQEYFPQMLQATRLLVLDYDVTRYHSFDLFRFLSTRRELFDDCDERIRNLYHPTVDQLAWYYQNAYSMNPYDHFTKLNGIIDASEMENRINNILQDELMRITPTDLNHQLGILFERNNVEGYLLKYTNDPHTVGWSDLVKVYTTDHLFNYNMAIAIIQKHRINAIMISSVEAAIVLCIKLEGYGYREPISFIIGDYGYNYEPDGAIKRIREMGQFEYARKHEFGFFRPYAGLKSRGGTT